MSQQRKKNVCDMNYLLFYNQVDDIWRNIKCHQNQFWNEIMDLTSGDLLLQC